MIQNYKKLLPQCVCFALFCTANVVAASQNNIDKDAIFPKSMYSGFLQDYTKLQQVTDSQGNALLRWVEPAIKEHRYQKFLVEDVVFFPQAKPTKQVSLEALEEIRHYIQSSIRTRLSDNDLLADAADKNVLKLRIAITAVDVKPESLKLWEIVPIALIRAGLQTASGRRDHDVKLFLESEAVDSQTQQVMLQSVREGTGLQLENSTQQLSLNQLKPKMDQWVENVMQSIAWLQKVD